MMQIACPGISDDAFLSSVLGHIDCQAQTLGSVGYQALANPASPVGLVLGGALTLFIALFGYRLLFGETPSVRDGIVSIVKIGIVLVLATSWPAFRTLAYDVALKAPAQLADNIGAPSGLPGAGGGLVARLQIIDDELAELYILGAGPPPHANIAITPANTNEPAPFRPAVDNVRWDPARDFLLLGTGRTVFLASTIAAFSSVRLIAGLLLALGPLFAIFLLFGGTRGLFEGWVRGLAGAALGALAASIVLGVELALMEPWLAQIIDLRRQDISTPAVPIELLVLTIVFGLTLVAALIAVARVAQGFHMPAAMSEAWGRAVDRVQEVAIPMSRYNSVGVPSEESRSRAATIADAVAASQRRENATIATATPMQRAISVASGASRDLAAAASVPLGQSFRRRTGGRVSASANRRDGGI